MTRKEKGAEMVFSLYLCVERGQVQPSASPVKGSKVGDDGRNLREPLPDLDGLALRLAVWGGIRSVAEVLLGVCQVSRFSPQHLPLKVPRWQVLGKTLAAGPGQLVPVSVRPWAMGHQPSLRHLCFSSHGTRSWEAA